MISLFLQRQENITSVFGNRFLDDVCMHYYVTLDETDIVNCLCIYISQSYWLNSILRLSLCSSLFYFCICVKYYIYVE